MALTVDQLTLLRDVVADAVTARQVELASTDRLRRPGDPLRGAGDHDARLARLDELGRAVDAERHERGDTRRLDELLAARDRRIVELARLRRAQAGDTADSVSRRDRQARIAELTAELDELEPLVDHAAARAVEVAVDGAAPAVLDLATFDYADAGQLQPWRIRVDITVTGDPSGKIDPEVIRQKVYAATVNALAEVDA